MGASELVNFIRCEAKKAVDSESPGLELGTVVSPHPQLAVRIDHMKLVLGPGDLVVCRSLVQHVRKVATVDEDFDPRSSFDGYETVFLALDDVLEAGERVLVQALPGGQKYVIIDRVVEV